MIYTDGIHLVADSFDELHAFANACYFQPHWFKDHASHPHYNIPSIRVLNRVLTRGAIQLTEREIVHKCKEMIDERERQS